MTRDPLPRTCEATDEVCDDCDGDPLTCLVRFTEDAGLYDDPKEPT